MAILAYAGTQLTTGASSLAGTFTNYIVESSTSGGKQVDFEDVDDADGALSTRLIFKRLPEVDFVLIGKAAATAAQAATDFPVGAMCAITGYTAWYVDSCQIATSKGAIKVTVKLINLGITIA